jgi:hypothetical protein
MPPNNQKESNAKSSIPASSTKNNAKAINNNKITTIKNNVNQQPEQQLQQHLTPASTIIKQLFAIAGGWWVFHYGLNFFLKFMSKTYRQMKRDTKLEVLININALITSAIICPMYYKACNQLNTSIKSRFEGYSSICHNALLLHCGQCIYETTTYMFQNKGIEFYLHHALVLINYFDVLKTGTMQYFAAKDGIVEGTNVPLCMINILRMFERSNHPLYILNGALLWLSYIPLRLLNLPMMVKEWMEDVSSEEGKKTWRKNTTLAKYTAIPTTIFLWILSCIWMVPISSGFLKAIKPYLLSSSK